MSARDQRRAFVSGFTGSAGTEAISIPLLHLLADFGFI